MAICDVYGVTPAQAGILFHATADSEDPYLNHIEMEIYGPLDTGALADAFTWVVQRHAVLCSGFHWAEADEPLQAVHDAVAWRPRLHDLSALTGTRQQEALRTLLDELQAEPMDLTDPPLMRVDLIRLSGHHTAALWTYHHLVLDGWSMATVYADLLRRYREGPACAPPPPRPFREHIAWLQAHPAAESADYWAAELAGATPTHPNLSAPRTSAPGYGRRILAIDSEVIAGLARSAQVTPGIVLHAAWALVLARFAGSPDVVFGTVVSGRPETVAGVEDMVGMFINTVPVRVRIDRRQRVDEFLRDQLAAQAARQEHDHVPLADIQRHAVLAAGEELLGTLLAIENFPIEADVVTLAEGVSVRLSRSVEHTHYPLTVTVLPGAVTTIEAEYRTGSYADRAVAAMLESLEHAISEMAAGPARPLASLAPLSPRQAAAVTAYGDGGPGGPAAPDIIDAFLAQARRRPAAAAVIDPDGVVMTYADLDAESASLAAWLGHKGIGLGDTVAFRLDRTSRLAVTILGILRSGAAYLPLDIAAPPRRAAAMLAQARAALVLDQDTLIDGAGQPGHGRPGTAGEPTRQAGPPPAAPAYVIFTSGSTGTPKGVVVSRAALSDHIAVMVRTYEMTADDVVLQLASPAFDLAAEEFFPAWSAGAVVVLAPARLPDTVADFVALLARVHVTFVNMATAYWQQWVTELRRLPVPPGLRLVVAGTEPMWPADAAEWLRRTRGVRFLNGYGVTEATITATLFEPAEPLPEADMVPAGRPLPGRAVHLLDQYGDPVPPGVIGELYIAGPGVATGYIGSPGATAARFLPCPAWARPGGAGPAGERWYRTGDLGYWLADGSLTLTGRADDQVKIRGHRVEPAEAEAVIAAHPAVGAAAVTVWPGASGPELAAYVVSPELDKVRSECEAELASFLRPSAWVPMSALPILASGKIDRQALPEPRLARQPAARPPVTGAPATGTQEWVADTWRDVLGGPAPGRADRFFALGGHSLTATQVVARARRAFDIDLPLRSLLGNPTLAGFAQAIDTARGGLAAGLPPVRPLRPDETIPLSFTQERLWFLDRLEDGPGYNITAAWRLSGELDETRLGAALAGIVARHAALRTCFPDRLGKPAAQVRERVPIDLLAGECADDPAAITAELEYESHYRFDLIHGPLFRFRLLRLGAADNVLIINVHHIVFDGWSHGVLMSELAVRYGAADYDAAAGSSPFEPLPFQYHEYAAWQRGWLTGEHLDGLLGYWREELAGSPPVLELPVTWPRQAPERYIGGHLYVEFGSGLRAAARALARDTDATLFVILLAGLAALLNRLTGQDDLVIGTPVAGRELPETERLIGCFINTLALRARITPGITFRELAERMRETAYAAYDHERAPFEKVVEAAGVTRSLDRQPLMSVMFVLQNMPGRPLSLRGLRATVLTMPEPAKTDLALTVGEEDGRLVGVWEYNAALFDAAAVSGFQENMVTLLGAALSDPDTELRSLPC